ncbi:hypothetical protein [Sulfurimonas sp.]
MANYNLEADISVQEIALGGTDDFMLYQFIMDSKSKSYIKDIFVKFKGKLIAKNYRDTLELFSMLDSFIKKGLVKGAENKFFKCVEKKEENQVRKSLQCVFNKKRYISMAEAKTMVQFYNESKIGYSFRTVLISDKVFSLTTTLEVEKKNVTLPSENDLLGMINGELDKYGVKYDNTPYFSEKNSMLLHHIKHKDENNENADETDD